MLFKIEILFDGSVKFPSLSFLISCFFVSGCLETHDDDKQSDEKNIEQSSLERKQEIKDLKLKVETLKWENARLSLKLITVDGSQLVLDKRTSLWHFDVDRKPFTGRAIELFPNDAPRGEADFHNGLKDGMERFWWPNGVLKEEGQWFAGKANGVFREWNENGETLKVVRYKNGQLVDIIYEKP